MASLSPKLEHSSPSFSADKSAPSPGQQKPQRVLACELCQKRKVKCDRKFPCAHCIKSNARCVPGTLAPRQRRRRFPERQLLERLHRYEDLLRQNNIHFEPLHKDSTGEKQSSIGDQGQHSDDEVAPTGNVETAYGAKSIWHAMSQGFRDSDHESDSDQDALREIAIKKAWDQSVTDDDHLLFGTRRTHVDLSTFHPDPVHTFRLWQTYLDNVNPMLKVIHAPTVQGRIIEAASNVTQVRPAMEALMFGIYCTAVLSLDTEDCQSIFGSSREDLLTKYQFGCQQSLSNCQFLRSNDRECLTALYLYLISIRPSTVPQSLSSMLGIAIRIAQRMGIHNESSLTKYDVLEAEMRRRLWWSLVLFDTRISEIANSKASILDPSWDCKIPLNVNDSDLRSDMRSPPTMQSHPTESLFAVVRSEIGDFIRHTSFHLDFTNPALKPIAKHFQTGPGPEDGELFRLEEMVENRYLKLCDEGNPLHFMTIWTSRARLAKCRLLEHLSRQSDSSARCTEAQRDAATYFAIKMLQCDAKIMTSPLTKRFLWLNHSHFPFPAYIQIAQDLRLRPTSEQAGLAWEVMNDSYDAWFNVPFRDDSAFFQIFIKIVLQAWAASEAAFAKLGQTAKMPQIVQSIKEVQAQKAVHSSNTHAELPDIDISMILDDLPTTPSLATGISHQNQPSSFEMQGGYTRPEMYPGMVRQNPFGTYMNHWDFAALGGQPGWQGFGMNI